MDSAAQVEEPVSLLGIAPTILEAAGIPKPPAFEGRSLIPLARGQKSASFEEIYGESFYGKGHFNTSALWTLRKGRYKYIQAPRPEFYDLSTDPVERNNLLDARRSLAKGYADRLAQMRSKAPPTQKTSANDPSPEVIARLRSLGYLAGSTGTTGPPDSGADPKDRIHDYEKYRRAVTLTGSNRLAEANQLLNEVLKQDPALIDAQIMLALNFQKLDDHKGAIGVLSAW